MPGVDGLAALDEVAITCAPVACANCSANRLTPSATMPASPAQRRRDHDGHPGPGEDVARDAAGPRALGFDESQDR